MNKPALKALANHFQSEARRLHKEGKTCEEIALELGLPSAASVQFFL